MMQTLDTNAAVEDTASTTIPAAQAPDELALLAHQVRNALAAIMGCARCAQRAQDPQKRDDMLQRLLTAADRASRMTDDVLERARMRHSGGTHVPEPKPFYPNEEVEEIVRSYMPATSERGLELLTELDPELSTEVFGSPLLVVDVLANFITNAMKYSPKGGKVTVRSEVHPAGIRLSVTDQGPGLSEELQARMFQPFVQGSGAKPGSGVGLSMCRQMLGQVGGTIGVDSVVGQGATFYFTVPYQRRD